MTQEVRTGVFICRCGEKISSVIDVDALARIIRSEDTVQHCEILPFSCLAPGLEQIMSAVSGNDLNRLIIAGCESRLMLKKFEKALEPLELLKGQIDMVNLRGHIAAGNDLSPQQGAEKGARLIKAAAAEMKALAPTIQQRIFLDGPVMIMGSGVASWTAAQELDRQGLEFMMVLETEDPRKVIEELHWSYPGEWEHFSRLQKTIQEVLQSSNLIRLPPGNLLSLSGVTGEYKLTFSLPDGGRQLHRAGAIIACLDAQFQPPAKGFGHDGQTVLIQPKFHEILSTRGFSREQIVFWVNDYEAGYPEFAQLSALSAWAMARRVRERFPQTRPLILYNEQMTLPLLTEDRVLARKLDIGLIPYDRAIQPKIQTGSMTVSNPRDQIEYEIPWELLVLSPERMIGEQTLNIAQTLGLVHTKGPFLTGHHARVRPEQVGREETYLAGSARFPCDLHEALSQGTLAGRKTADLFQESKSGALFVPRIVCAVDGERCIGCGMCQELCDCGGIGVEDSTGGGLPRVVDPLMCTGGGTCVAACPYKALVLQNHTTDQWEERISALAGQLGPDDVIALCCAWGGLPAADNAGKKRLSHDSRVHILGVPCIGQLDPGVFARAFIEGAPGLLLIGCEPEECHHSFGVDHAWSRVDLIKRLLTLSGFDRGRIALAHADLNEPEQFIRTVNSFAETVAALGPIARTPQNMSKLQSMYDLVAENSRIRHLLCVTLRQNSETEYRGNALYPQEFDQDFSTAVQEEFLRSRMLHLLRCEKRALSFDDFRNDLMEKRDHIGDQLFSMLQDGLIHRVQDNHKTLFMMS